jgi:hypothetical protein
MMLSPAVVFYPEVIRTMSRYFFNTRGAEHESDLEGCEFSNVAEAKLAAIMFAGAYLRDNPSLVLGPLAWHVEVRDHEAVLLYTITMKGSDARQVDPSSVWMSCI